MKLDAVRNFCRENGYSSEVVEGGLEYLLARWQGVVITVKTNACDVFDEYLSDMDYRQIIWEVVPLACPAQRDEALRILASTDPAFQESTVEIGQCIWGGHNEAKYGYKRAVNWWYYRLPRNVAEEWLRDYLEPGNAPGVD